jgi:hypothetical protein
VVVLRILWILSMNASLDSNALRGFGVMASGGYVHIYIGCTIYRLTVFAIVRG